MSDVPPENEPEHPPTTPDDTPGPYTPDDDEIGYEGTR